MAIKFESGSLSTPETNVYSLSNFNGVDYTTTPTLVDDSRGIDMSNYLPQNNTLTKRNGWSVINDFWLEIDNIQEKAHIYNIWKFKNNKDPNEKTNTNYIILCDLEPPETNYARVGLYYTNSLIQTDNYKFELLEYGMPSIYNSKKTPPYSYGILFENRLFILAFNKYFMLYYEKNKDLSTEENIIYDLKIDEVKNQAFIPQVIVGLGHKKSQDTAVKVNDFNLLRNECYIELINYPQTTESQILSYDIGQFFGNTMTNISILKVDNQNYEEDMDYSKEDGTYVGKIRFNSSNKILTIIKNSREEDPEYLESATYINLHIKFDSDNYKIVENMRFGIPYGSSGYRDRLFLSGNAEYPNLDIHTNETGLENENWLDYTYFGDLSYRNFGTDAQKITGYGILNNGYMAIFKETSDSLSPNLYIRRSEISADSNGNYVENFPVSLSGITIGSDEVGQVINYGNDLLINSPKGIFKVVASNSTATQTFEAQEMSYYIRDNLNTDISDSCSIIFDGKLYITRKDYKGDTRVYVADQNKYSYIDGVRVYEWWVLDGINAVKFYIFDNELYFIDHNKGLCKFNKEHSDDYYINITNVKVNDVLMSKEVSIDTTNDYVILSPESSIISDIKTKENIYESYINLKNTTTISFDNDIITYLKSEYYEFINLDDGENYLFELKILCSEKYSLEKLLEYTINNNLKILQLEETSLSTGYVRVFSANGDYRYDFENINGELKKVFIIRLLFLDYKEVDFDYKTTGVGIEIPSQTRFEIEEVYEQYNEYPLSECFVNDNTWYRNYTDNLGNKQIESIGNVNHINFNKCRLKFLETPILFLNYYNFVVYNVKFFIKEPVVSYWKSKYNSLGRLDFLKTIYSITIVPEMKISGSTNISYKTSKSEVSFDIFTEGQDFDFETINFNDFTFGGAGIAKTYTSKKKIKNFSFIQLKFSSNDPKNSSIVSLGFRYKYTRLNKGER